MPLLMVCEKERKTLLDSRGFGALEYLSFKIFYWLIFTVPHIYLYG